MATPEGDTLRKESVEEPLVGFVVVMAESEKPVTVAVLVFDAIIVAVLALLVPPFLFDAFGAIGFDNFVKF